MKQLETALESLGLKAKEAKIYVALLELGDAPVALVAKRTGIKRTTVYNILPDLVNRGLVSTTTMKGRKRYFIKDPRMLQREIREKESAINELLPQLRAIQNVLPEKPRITYYEGEGGMKELYQDTLDSLREGETILSFTGLSDFTQLMPDKFAKFYIQQRIERKIRIRIVSTDSPTARLWEKNAAQELRDMRIVPKLLSHFNADMEIYANKVALLSYRENFLGVIIESKEISQMQRAAFELMWSALEKAV